MHLYASRGTMCIQRARRLRLTPGKSLQRRLYYATIHARDRRNGPCFKGRGRSWTRRIGNDGEIGNDRQGQRPGPAGFVGVDMMCSMLRFRAVTATVGLCLLVLTGLPPPSSISAEDPPTPEHSSDIQERGLGGVRRPEAAPFSKMLEMAPTPQADLIGRKISSSGCGPGRIGLAVIEVKNQGAASAGAFFTQVNSYNKQVRVRTGALPPGGAFAHQIAVGCPPQGSCVVTGLTDVDREVVEANEANNGFSFSCP